MVVVVKKPLVFVIVIVFCLCSSNCGMKKDITDLTPDSIMALEDIFNLDFPDDVIFIKAKYYEMRDIELYLIIQYSHEKFSKYLDENPEKGYSVVTNYGTDTEYSQTGIVYADELRGIPIFFTKGNDSTEYLEFIAVDADIDCRPFLESLNKDTKK